MLLCEFLVRHPRSFFSHQQNIYNFTV
jgi:hypothetical protein